MNEELKTVERVHTHTHINLSDKKRVDYIDIARGIAIILMVIGHCIGRWPRKIIFSFHMPLFIIVSGMFFKEDKKLKDIVWNLLKKLIVPYAIVIFLVAILRMIIYSESFNIISTLGKIILGCTFENKKYTVDALWFIPFFLVSQVVFYIINKISKEDDLLKGVICLICTFIGIYLGEKQLYLRVILPCSIDIVFASTIFYYIGYIFKKYNILDKILNKKTIIICMFLLYCIGMLFNHIEFANRQYPYGITSYVTAIVGTTLVFQLSKLIEKFPKFMPNTLKWFGKNSMYILIFHHLESLIINYESLGITRGIVVAPIKLIIITTCMLLFINLKNLIIKKLN